MKTKELDLCGVGNALVDVLIQVTEEELRAAGCEKGSFALVGQREQDELLKYFGDRPHVLASGGSAANSVILFSQLGGSAAFICSIGPDKYGSHFSRECIDLGMRIGSGAVVDHPTGLCVSLVTPDAERTLRTFLGAALFMTEAQIDVKLMAASKWIFLEGYLFGSGNGGLAAIEKACKCAKEHHCKIAFTFSAVPVVDQYKEMYRDVVRQSDLVFANEGEGEVYTGRADIDGMLDVLAEEVPHAVITAGADGAFIHCNGERQHVPALSCDPVDLTGAGDAFAGAYLFFLSRGFSPRAAAEKAVWLAKEVICQFGARLPRIPETETVG